MRSALNRLIRVNRIYILPTQFGVLFFISVVVMLLVGATYANNLVNLLAFFLGSIGFVAMVQTHNNLKDIRITECVAEAGFSQSAFVIQTTVESTSKQNRYNLTVRARDLTLHSVHPQPMPLVAGGRVKLSTAYIAGPRGLHPVGRLSLSTEFPLGLFRAWVVFENHALYFSYPKPEGTLSLPETNFGNHSLAASGTMEGEDYRGHRLYQPGDSSRHIDWKAVARGRTKLVKEFRDGEPQCVLLSYEHLSGNTEQRLAQLSQWIETARRKEMRFALQIPGKLLPAGNDFRHYHRCLEELTIFNENGVKKNVG